MPPSKLRIGIYIINDPLCLITPQYAEKATGATVTEFNGKNLASLRCTLEDHKHSYKPLVILNHSRFKLHEKLPDGLARCSRSALNLTQAEILSKAFNEKVPRTLELPLPTGEQLRQLLSQMKDTLDSWRIEWHKKGHEPDFSDIHLYEDLFLATVLMSNIFAFNSQVHTTENYELFSFVLSPENRERIRSLRIEVQNLIFQRIRSAFPLMADILRKATFYDDLYVDVLALLFAYHFAQCYTGSVAWYLLKGKVAKKLDLLENEAWLTENYALIQPWIYHVLRSQHDAVIKARRRIDMVPMKTEYPDALPKIPNTPDMLRAFCKKLAGVSKEHEFTPIFEAIVKTTLSAKSEAEFSLLLEAAQDFDSVFAWVFEDIAQKAEQSVRLAKETYELETANYSSFSVSEWVRTYEHILTAESYMSEAAHEIRRKYVSSRKKFSERYEEWFLRQYPLWLKGEESAPTLTKDIPQKIRRLLQKCEEVFLIVIDNMPLQVWWAIRDGIGRDFLQKLFFIEESFAFSVIPSVTHISRRCLFSGKTYEQYVRATFDVLGKRPDDEKQLLVDSLDGAYGVTYTFPTAEQLESEESILLMFKQVATEPTEVKTLVFSMDEIAHRFRFSDKALIQVCGILAGVLRPILEEIAKRKKPGIIITSDHGHVRRRKKMTDFPINDWEHILVLQNKAGKHVYNAVAPRYAIIAEKYGVHIDPFDLNTILKSHQLGRGHVLLDMDKYGLGTRVLGFDNVKAIVLAKDREYFSKSPRPLVHGGVTPYETVVPYIVLLKKD
jgi:hypothetical protein